MTDLRITVKIKDLKSAYEEGCDDVKRVLRKMYPEIFKDEWEDVTREIESRTKITGEGDAYVQFFHRNIEIGRYTNEGFALYSPDCNYRVEIDNSSNGIKYFRVFKKQ